MRRLQEMRPGQATSLFTSDLSVNEFLLVREAGFTPLGLVLGSSIYHVGIQVGRWSKNQELDVLSQAMYHARELAMSRMEAEADVLGADGIVGVRLEVEFKEWGSDIAEFIAVGTAVKADRPRGDRPGLAQQQGPAVHLRPVRPGLLDPASSPGTGRSAWSWARASTTSPTAASATCCRTSARTPSCRSSPRRCTTRGSWRWSACRPRRKQLGAEGIVGVQLRNHAHTWGGHTTEFFAIGTAVTPLRADHVIAKPTMVLGLDS